MSGEIPYKTVLNSKEIEKILPHRYPFLMVDRIVHIDLEASEIIGLKNLSMNEPFFQGHFPGVPIMPGVLILEAIAQTGGILVHQSPKGTTDKIAVLSSITNAKFRHPVTPGDVLYLHVKGNLISSKGGRMQARAMVNNQIMAECELSCIMVSKDKL